jgi:hypothetical protein
MHSGVGDKQCSFQWIAMGINRGQVMENVVEKGTVIPTKVVYAKVVPLVRELYFHTVGTVLGYSKAIKVTYTHLHRYNSSNRVFLIK